MNQVNTITSVRPDMTWYRNARFGMFIHWGIYAIPGGIWKGEKSANEWIMHRSKIPVKEYEKLAAQFNPVNFSAEYIVNLAKDAGMKYLVITAKHHDGFAMYHSKVSKYNIVDATPFKRDVVGELANECAKQGIRFGVYYSQSLDWHHPHAVGNTWDWPDESKKDYQIFLDELVYPQVEELLTNYGDISVLWFDTPRKITDEQAKDLLNFVRQKQPQCIINSRIGPSEEKEWGDFVSLRDNEVPTLPLDHDAETCATLNGSWGYSKHDHHWKSPESITQYLADIAAKNANYLLNIGPDALGNVPERSVEILREVGTWLQTNGEAIYHTSPSPFHVNFEWGAVTRKPGKLFCHLFENKEETFQINGIKNKITKAYNLDDPQHTFEVTQQPVNESTDVTLTAIDLPSRNHSKFHSVLCLELENGEEPIIDTRIMQQPDHSVVLESLVAKEKETGERIPPETLLIRGAVGKSLRENMTLIWEFEIFKAGKYQLIAECATGRYADDGGKRVVDTGHEVEISFCGKTIEAVIREDVRTSIRGNSHNPCILSALGEVEISVPGKYCMEMKIKKVVMGKGQGFILRNVQMQLQ